MIRRWADFDEVVEPTERDVFRQGDGWKAIHNGKVILEDGSVLAGQKSEGCIMLLAECFCEAHGLNIFQLYREAYAVEWASGISFTWLLTLEEDWVEYTEIPETINLKLLLDDLADINYHAFRLCLIGGCVSKGIL